MDNDDIRLSFRRVRHTFMIRGRGVNALTWDPKPNKQANLQRRFIPNPICNSRKKYWYIMFTWFLSLPYGIHNGHLLDLVRWQLSNGSCRRTKVLSIEWQGLIRYDQDSHLCRWCVCGIERPSPLPPFPPSPRLSTVAEFHLLFVMSQVGTASKRRATNTNK